MGNQLTVELTIQVPAEEDNPRFISEKDLRHFAAGVFKSCQDFKMLRFKSELCSVAQWSLPPRPGI